LVDLLSPISDRMTQRLAHCQFTVYRKEWSYFVNKMIIIVIKNTRSVKRIKWLIFIRRSNKINHGKFLPPTVTMVIRWLIFTV
jgi:hypothetical protein